MHRRGFLQLATRLSAWLGVASPVFGAATLQLDSARDASQGKKARDIEHGSSGPQSLAVLLDKQWLIGIDPGNIGRDHNWFGAAQPSAKATFIPSTIQETYPYYHGVAWYWCKFPAEKSPYLAGRYLLRFNAIDYKADVWLNGTLLGSHEGGETPFVLDATDAIRLGESTNLLAVRVLNPSNERIDGIVLDEVPHGNRVMKFQNGASFNVGGILQPVELLLVPAIHIADVHVIPDWHTGIVQIRVRVTNTSGKQAQGQANFVIAGSGGIQTAIAHGIDVTFPVGDSTLTHDLRVANHQLWELERPYLYQLSVSVENSSFRGYHEARTNFGFRDFRLTDGYFRLNGKRVFIRSTHTGNNVPYGQVVPPPSAPDLLRRDLLYAKASGFNTVRFIACIALPYQLHLCDELGLLVYEESFGSWLLKDSPQMKARFENSFREMVLRDRNHPSVAIWGVLNETEDGPVFQEAISTLPLLRSLDKSRLALLSSGRFDGHLDVGSASNPGSDTWEYTWGAEAPGATKVKMALPSGPGIGDFHLYPSVPQSEEANNTIRALGQNTKPVFLSEYGIGSMMDVIHEARMCEQAGIPPEAEDYIVLKSMADRFSADWLRLGMNSVYPYPESLLQASQASMARHRLLGFNLIRSNPNICGFNLTGMLDHAMTGEGIWRFWRDWKPGAFDACRDGWAPVRWCLFVEPTHTYVGRPVTLEAVLANEDAIQPGSYSAHFRASGPQGVAWEADENISIPEPKAGKDGLLAISVLKSKVILQGGAGAYELVPSISNGIAPPETSWQFHLSDAKSLPRLDGTLTTWGIPGEANAWLMSHGAVVKPLTDIPIKSREVVLVGDVSQVQASASMWKHLAAMMVTGSTVVFLSPLAFNRDKQSTAWLPLTNKGRVYKFNDWLYHKECVAKSHPILAGLQGNGILDWYYYGPMIPHYLFDGQDTPAEIVAAAFATGYSTPGGYASGIILGSYNFGAGRFIVNTFPILDHIDSHPVADRLLLNLVAHASESTKGLAAALPPDFQTQLQTLGYPE